MGKESQITIRPEQIRFGSHNMKISGSDCGRYKIPYHEIVAAFLQIPDEESGTYHEPDITEITRDLKGDLILYDSGHGRWRIRTDLTGMAAGGLLEDLAIHAPYILIGGSEKSWLDLDNAEEFAEAVKMTEIMRCY